MALSISPSPFGTLAVTVKDTPGTVIVSTVATSPSVLTMALGVPGPTGATGAAGQNGTNGTNGSNGVGVPTGGTAGQSLVKSSDNDYETNWDSMLPLSGGILNGNLGLYVESGMPYFGIIDDIIGNSINLTGSKIGFSLYGEEVLTNLTGNGLTFIDGSFQSTAFPPTGGTSVQYIDGTGGLKTFPTIPSLTGYATETYVTTRGYITSSALSPYLTSSSAASTYLTQSSAASTYLTQSSAASTYLSQSSAASTYFAKPTGDSSQYLNGTGTPVTFPTVGTAGKMIVLSYNQTGSTIAKGSVVYISGSHGNDPQISLARADLESTSAYTIGVTESAISNNSTGNVIVLGLLEGFNTSSYSDGDALYLSSTTYGGFTATKQFSPNHYVKVGTVVRAHPTAGTVFIKVENGYQLDELSDCYVTAPTNNNVLTFESSTGLWKDKSVTTALGYTPANDTLGNLSSASTARTNLGLGSMALETASNYLTASSTAGVYLSQSSAASTYTTKANNLSDLASATTARTNLGVAYATDAQVIAGTSASTVIAPSSAKSLRYTNNGSEIDLTPYAWLSSFTTWAGTRNRLNFPINGTTAIGQGMWTIENQYANIGGTQGIDWTKRISLVGRFSLSQTSPTSNNIFRYTLGKLGNTSFGDLTTRGIGVRCLFGSALEIQCHNGTTLTNFTTSFTPTFNNTLFEVRVESDGSGNCTCFVNGTQVGTTTGAPTTASSSTLYNTNFELVSATTNTNAPTAGGSAFKVNYGY